MDPVTHGVSGLIGAKFLRLKFHIPSHYGWLFFLGALLPDIDNVVGFLGKEAYVLHHRGITHSLVFAALFPVPVAFLLKSISPKWNFHITWITLSASILLHIFLDVITSYGTQIFMPFSRFRFALDWVFIVDPIFTAILLTLFILSRRKPCMSTVALLAIFCYPVICGVLHFTAERRVISSLQPARRIHVTPEFGTPLYWKVITENLHTYRVTRYFLPGGRFDGPALEFDKPRFLQVTEDNGAASKTLDIYKWFALFPFQISSTNPHRKVLLGDLRFISTWRMAKKDRRVPFSVIVTFDDSGRVKEAHFVE